MYDGETAYRCSLTLPRADRPLAMDAAGYSLRRRLRQYFRPPVATSELITPKQPHYCTAPFALCNLASGRRLDKLATATLLRNQLISGTARL